MNITANTVASKLFVAFVAAAMLVTLATPAKAATATELQAQIDALMAQISALTGSTDSGAGSAGCTFTRSLTLGSEGSDVNCLQNYLTSTGHFNFSGGSTGYFGSVTASAVAAWQGANGVSPAVGYFGPVSQAKYNALVASAPADDSDDSDDSSDDSDDSASDLSGEASLDDMAIDAADDSTLEEGAEDAEIARVTFTFQDGDAMITRMDVTLDGVADVWDVLDEVALMVDGDEVARASASDEDDYLDTTGSEGTLRFSGLDLVAMEDEDLEVTIVASTQGNIDTLDQGAYTVSVDNVRFVDADGVTDTVSTPGEFATDVSFDIEEAGTDDEIIVKTATTDVLGTTFELEDDTRSSFETVFAFDLDTDDSVNDIELTTVVVTVETTGSTTAATYNKLVDDAELVIDGVTIDDVVVTGGGTQTATLTFDVDGAVTIDAGDRVVAELNLRFKALNALDEGATVQGSVTTGNADAIEAEGADDLDPATQISGSATGDEHTLRTMGIIAEVGDLANNLTAPDGATNDYATMSIELEVTAFNQDVYISTDPALGIVYGLQDSAGAAATASGTPTLSSTADDTIAAGYFFVGEGESETFTLEVTYLPAVANTPVRLQLHSLEYAATGIGATDSWVAAPAQTYRTAVKNIVN